jgi:hypothetical protein
MKAEFIGMFIGADATVEFKEKGKDYSVCNATFQEIEDGEPAKGKYIVAQVWGDELIGVVYELKVNAIVDVRVNVSTRRAKNDKTRTYNKITLDSIATPLTNGQE